MSLATETRELTLLKMEIIHKIFLINQLHEKGFEGAARNRPKSDVVFLASIVDADLSRVKKLLEAELFEF